MIEIMPTFQDPSMSLQDTAHPNHLLSRKFNFRLMLLLEMSNTSISNVLMTIIMNLELVVMLSPLTSEVNNLMLLKKLVFITKLSIWKMVLTELPSPFLGLVNIMYMPMLMMNLMVSSLINHSNSMLFTLLVLTKHLSIVQIKSFVLIIFIAVTFKTIHVLKIQINH